MIGRDMVATSQAYVDGQEKVVEVVKRFETRRPAHKRSKPNA